MAFQRCRTMADTLELESVVEAAQQAAAAGNYADAERLLRQVAERQETLGGPQHPHLANTLNNLGVVCERAGKLDDAEQCYRRAHAIATSALGPDDPLTITSGQNLEEFCAARDIPVEPKVETPAPRELRASVPVPAKATGIPPAAIGALLILVMALGMYAVYSRWSAGNAVQKPEAPERLAVPAREAVAPRPVPPNATPPPVAAPVARAPAVTNPAPARAAPIVVAEARVCRALSTSTWTCTPSADPASPGVLFYFTRVKTGQNTSIEHRWYFEERLVQSVRLRVASNPGAGFRTYSRHTVSSERAGNWRVELRDAGGTVLHQAQFTVSVSAARSPTRPR